MIVRTRPTIARRPFALMNSDLDRLIDTLVPRSMRPPLGDELDRGFVPAMNVWEDEKGFHVDTELPGVPMDDIEVMATTDSITVKGEHSDRTPDNSASHVCERTFGAFERFVTLPSEIEPDAVKARLDHGVLHLTAPKADTGKHPRKVKISSNDREQTPAAKA